jgi:hypothetical protein
MMSSAITFPFKLAFRIIGTLLRALGLLLSFGFKGMRFGGSRLVTVIAGIFIGLFLGKKYMEKKAQQGPQETK